MRSIGAAERALELMCKRLNQRVAFGKPHLAAIGLGASASPSRRCMIEQARLLTLKAAYMMDTAGNKVAQGRDRDDQGGGAQHELQGGGLGHPGPRRRRRQPATTSGWPTAYAHQRTLRMADGPDEVHRNAHGQAGAGQVRRHRLQAESAFNPHGISASSYK
jgi:acyl-CoA dehydrogenase